MAQPHRVGGQNCLGCWKKENCWLLSSGTNWGDLWRWGWRQGIWTEPVLHCLHCHVSVQNTLSANLLFLFKTSCPGCGTTDIVWFLFACGFYSLINTWTSCTSKLDFDLPETCVDSCDATVVRCHHTSQQCPGPLLTLPSPRLSPPLSSHALENSFCHYTLACSF